MNIVIVESPAKAKTINKYLGPGYRVLASYGHVRDLIPKLYRMGYRGPLTIEREISGERQIADIQRAKALLEEIRAPLLGGRAAGT